MVARNEVWIGSLDLETIEEEDVPDGNSLHVSQVRHGFASSSQREIHHFMYF